MIQNNIIDFKAKKLNQKSIDSVKNTGYMNVWEGAVRSGKTVVSLLAWLIFVLMSPEQVFIMSGRTLGTLYRNCIGGKMGFLALTGGTATYKKDPTGYWYISWLGKQIYCFGADNKSSFGKIRGMTAGGWYADEVNLQDKEFIEEALRRTIDCDDRRHFWTLNPTYPTHWIYTDENFGLDTLQKKRESGELDGLDMAVNIYHWELTDNPTMTQKKIDLLKIQYSGVFYDRYILGLRVVAEGIIYKTFAENANQYIIKVKGGNYYKTNEDGTETKIQLPRFTHINIGVDYGGRKSGSAFVAVGFTYKFKETWVLEDEFRKGGIETPDSLKSAFIAFCDRVRTKFPNVTITCYADSAEQLLNNALKNAIGKTHVPVKNSKKKPIIDRIRLINLITEQGRFFVLDNCKTVIDGFSQALWDDSKMDDVRLDDFTTNIDIVDATEYAIEPNAKQISYGEVA